MAAGWVGNRLEMTLIQIVNLRVTGAYIYDQNSMPDPEPLTDVVRFRPASYYGRLACALAPATRRIPSLAPP